MLGLVSAAPPRRRSLPTRATQALRRRIDAHIRRQAPPPLQVVWSQDLTIHSRDRLLHMIRLLLERCPGRHVRLDLECCHYLSEEGIEALLLLRQEAEGRGVRLHVHAPVGQPRRKMAVTRLGDLLR